MSQPLELKGWHKGMGGNVWLELTSFPLAICLGHKTITSKATDVKSINLYHSTAMEKSDSYNGTVFEITIFIEGLKASTLSSVLFPFFSVLFTFCL